MTFMTKNVARSDLICFLFFRLLHLVTKISGKILSVHMKITGLFLNFTFGSTTYQYRKLASVSVVVGVVHVYDFEIYTFCAL